MAGPCAWSRLSPLDRAPRCRRRTRRGRLFRGDMDVTPRAIANRVIAVVGLTATGKSELAVALAQRIDGEVINADSMQLYRGMDIGTAKLPHGERGGVPHHLLDIWPVA